MEASHWFKVGAKVRVDSAYTPIAEGTITAITYNGFYLTKTAQLDTTGMNTIEPPREKYFGWQMFLWAELIEPAAA